MTDAWRRIVAFLVAVPMAMSGVVFASSGEARTPAETAWAQAVQRNSLEAYAEFVMDYPDSEYSRQAYAKLSSIATIPAADRAMAKIKLMDSNLFSEPNFIPRWRVAS